MLHSIGRIVHYRIAQDDDAFIDRPAIVVAVHEDGSTVNLQVFWNREHDQVEWREKVPCYEGDVLAAPVGTWHWPPRT